MYEDGCDEKDLYGLMLILLGEKVVQHVFVSYTFLYDVRNIRSSPFSTILRVEGDIFEDA